MNNRESAALKIALTLPLLVLFFLVPQALPAGAAQPAAQATSPAPIATPVATSAPTMTPQPGVSLTWYGQSTILIRVENGPTILADPVAGNMGYRIAPLDGVDVVTVSHEHADHNNVTLATGSPKILRGLANNDWAKVDETIKGVRIRDVNTFHDDTQGSARGKNAVFVIEANGMRLVHLGDLGHQLSAEQVKEIGPVDVLLIPVGGFYTIDAAGANKVIEALKPKAVVPMHYKTPAVALPVATVDAFVLGKNYQWITGNQISMSLDKLPKTTTTYLLGYEAPQMPVTFSWYGQSTFTMQVQNGPTVLTDPVAASVGYKVPPLDGVDVVTVSHEHADHNNVALATGTPKILRGLANNDWAKIDETIKGVRIRDVNTFHDDSQGSARGKNAVFCYEANGLRIVHLGDLGGQLSADQIKEIGAVDVLMIPVGGNFTIDAPAANKVVDALKPRVVVPMHFKTPAVSLDLAGVDPFLAGKTVRIVDGNKFALSNTTLPISTTVFVPGYLPAAPVTTTQPMTLTWFGQSMFTLNVPSGPNIMLDPVGASVGYKVTPVAGVDVVTVSHEHADHNNVALATGSPKILRGLANNDWAKVDETIKGVRIRDVNTFHDDTQGSARGKNAVFVIEANGMRLVHLGDLGHQLSAEQVKEIGPVDVLLIPVGGFYTIDAAGANKVIEALKPKAVVPMHYKTPPIMNPVLPVDNFLLGKTYQVMTGNQIVLSVATLPKTTTVFVPQYEAP